MANSKASDGPPVQHVVHHEAPPAIELILEKHGKKIAILLVVGVIAVCAAFVMRALKAERLVEASQAFTDAETIADFEKVAEDEKGTPAGGSALLMLAARHEAFGKYEDARIALLQFTKEYGKHPRYYQGLFDLALVSEKLGQKDEASKYLNEVAAAPSELAPLALLRQAENTAESGDLKGAKEAMEGIAAKHPSNPFIEHIDTRIKAIEQRIILAENPPPAPEQEPEPVVTPTPDPTGSFPIPTPTPGAPDDVPTPAIEFPNPTVIPSPSETPRATETPAEPEATEPVEVPEPTATTETQPETEAPATPE